jgi:16S rRNA (uracil1498-N3)-methyltransferase
MPLETSRTAGVATRLQPRHLEKLRRQALETLKQSGSAWAMSISDPTPLDRFLADPPAVDGWLADASGNAPPSSLSPQPVTVVIGPEGGFTDSEREAIVAAGYRPMRLGAHTLRFETAALAAAAAVNAARLRGNDG